MKIEIFSSNKETVSKASEKAIEMGFVCGENPEIIITLGGDGTLLMAERLYPGVPKVNIKMYEYDEKIITECLNKIKDGKYSKIELIKLKTSEKECMNDFVIRNSLQTSAIRFNVYKNGEKTHEVIGDGIVVSTPFGSSGYNFSITRKTFEKGIGIAFNNPVEELEGVNFEEDSEIQIEITRGDAKLSSDNDEDIITLKTGDNVKITKSENKAVLVEFD